MPRPNDDGLNRCSKGPQPNHEAEERNCEMHLEVQCRFVRGEEIVEEMLSNVARGFVNSIKSMVASLRCLSKVCLVRGDTS